jgi:hypothetical protein
MQESVSSRILCEKISYDLQSPNGRSHEKPTANEEIGKKPVASLLPGSHEHLALRKHLMCARNMGAHVQSSTLESQR